MTIAPVVFRPQPVPDLARMAGALATYCVAQSLLVAAFGLWSLVLLSLAMAAAFATLALWYIQASQDSSVMVDGDHLIVRTDGDEISFDRQDIESIDLTRVGRELQLTDGSTVSLPLDSDALVQASLLMAPTIDSSPPSDA